MDCDLKGFERLAVSMLVQAMADLRSGFANRRSAWEWMEGSGEGHLSFAQCCRTLGRDPEQVRGLMLRRLYRDSAVVPLDVRIPLPQLIPSLRQSTPPV
jgi:hypothetical protein